MAWVALLSAACMAGVLVVLGSGVVYMAFGKSGASYAERSNRLMAWRVGLQALAVVLLALAAAFR